MSYDRFKDLAKVFKKGPSSKTNLNTRYLQLQNWLLWIKEDSFHKNARNPWTENFKCCYLTTQLFKKNVFTHMEPIPDYHNLH